MTSLQEKDPQQVGEKKREAVHEEAMVGPSSRKLQKMDFSDLIMDGLPTSEQYEISFMHKDVVNKVISAPKTETIITLSVDGHVKFWTKAFTLVDFGKNFKAHNGLITGAALSQHQDLLCTCGLDRTLKIFDILNCELKMAIKLSFIPSSCEFIPQEGKDWYLVAVSEDKTGKIWIVDPEAEQTKKSGLDDDEEVMPAGWGQEEAQQGEEQLPQDFHIITQVTLHKHPIKFIKMNWNLGVCFSLDEHAVMEVWDPYTYEAPLRLPSKFKNQKEFDKLLEANATPLCLSLSPKGTYAAIMLKDKVIRIFDLRSGKIIDQVSENIKDIIKIQEDPAHPQHSSLVLDEHDFEKKIHIEKDLQITKQFLFNPNVEFNETEDVIVYASFHGIKMYSLANKCTERVLGHHENERYIRVSLYQGKVMRNPNGNANVYGERKASDPLIICTAFRKGRFYMFSRRPPQLQGENAAVRDIINEKHTKEQAVQQIKPVLTEKQNEVLIQTSMGDIHVLLYLEDCPRTCENFIKLVRKNYYNGMIFHRVIKGFMNQTGCPLGNGTGGESIWGGHFEDELRPEKYRFDKPYVLAMANRGPNTNGSQFFITVIPCPWLDNKHTIFGRVLKGIDTVCEINKLKTDKAERPLKTVKIMNAKVI